MAIKKFKVQLLIDIEEKKLVGLGAVHDKNGVKLRNMFAIAIADPDVLFPTVIIENPVIHKVARAEITIEFPDKIKNNEITLKKGKKAR